MAEARLDGCICDSYLGEAVLVLKSVNGLARVAESICCRFTISLLLCRSSDMCAGGGLLVKIFQYYYCDGLGSANDSCGYE